MSNSIQERLEKAFTKEQSQVLSEVITESYNNLVKVSDFNELKAIVERIAKSQAEIVEVQKRTDQRLDKLTERVDTLAQKVDELAEAQKRTDQRLDKLTERVDTLAQKVDELAEAQKRTDQRVDTLAQKVDELAEAQKRTEETMRLGFQKVNDQIAALGGRWGIKNETMLRNTLHNLLKDLGYTVSRAYYGDREVDILIRNGEHILLEVTSSAKKKDVHSLNLSAEDYYSRHNVEPRLILASVYISPVVMREILNSPRKIEIYSGDEDEEEMFL